MQIVELENRLKRAENDTVSCKARVNSLKTQIQVENMVSCNAVGQLTENPDTGREYGQLQSTGQLAQNPDTDREYGQL